MSAEPDPDGGFPGATYCAATGKVRHPSRKVAAENLKRFLAGRGP